jgi:hypothetical protein
MKIEGLKKLIKEAVREAIQEELKDILLEAVKSPKTVVQEAYVPTPTQPVAFQTSGTTVNHDLRRNLRSMIGGEFDTLLLLTHLMLNLLTHHLLLTQLEKDQVYLEVK